MSGVTWTGARRVLAGMTGGLLALTLAVSGVPGEAAGQVVVTPEEGARRIVIETRGEDRVRIGVFLEGGQSAETDSQGVRLADVVEDGPAYEAGLREGDIITSLDGHRLTEPLAGDVEDGFDEDMSLPVQRLQAIVDGLSEGDAVEVSYMRDGESATTRLTPRAMGGASVFRWNGEEGGQWSVMPDAQFHIQEDAPRVFSFRIPDGEGREEVMLQYQGQLERHRQELDRHRRELDRARSLREQAIIVAPRAPRAPGVLAFRSGGCAGELGLLMSEESGCVDGVRMIQLNPQLGSYFGVEEGVLVTEVGEDPSLALEPGDVILRIGGRDVKSPGHAARILASYDSEEAISMEVRRKGREITVSGTME